MNGARHHLFAGSAFSRDQYRGFAVVNASTSPNMRSIAGEHATAPEKKTGPSGQAASSSAGRRRIT